MTAGLDWRRTDADLEQIADLDTQELTRYEDRLAVVNRTQMDARLHFEETGHVYTLDGEILPWSTTAFIGRFFPSFCAETVSERLAERPERAVELGYVTSSGNSMTAAEIRAEWSRRALVSRLRGSLVHWQAYAHFNGYFLGTPHSPDFGLILAFDRGFLSRLGLRPWRAELTLVLEELRLGGSADLVCVDGSGSFVVVDWKRSRRLEEREYGMAAPPLESLPATSRSKYYVQLNLYARMLQLLHGVTVSGMYIVGVHPDVVPYAAHVYDVPRLEQELDELLAVGRTQIPSNNV